MGLGTFLTGEQKRCYGNCCRKFRVPPEVFSQIQNEYRDWKLGARERIDPDVPKLVEMLIPLGKEEDSHYFSCKNLGSDGNCQTYEERPQMCRAYPGTAPCKNPYCELSTLRFAWKKGVTVVICAFLLKALRSTMKVLDLSNK